MPEPEFRLCADYYLQHLTPLFGEVETLMEVGANYRLHGANGYEPSQPRLDVHHLRETIRYAAATRSCLARTADDLGIARPREILSLADLANRLVSVRLEPERHPVAGDRPWALVGAAGRAARRRRDMAWTVRTMFVVWFAITAALPRGAAAHLAEIALFPERRSKLNALLAAVQRGVPR
jgi:hypothetical protein